MGETSDSEANDSEEIDIPNSSAADPSQQLNRDDSQPERKSKPSSSESSDESSDETSTKDSQATCPKISKKKRAIVSSDSDSEEEPVINKAQETKCNADEKGSSDEELTRNDSESRDKSKPASCDSSQKSDDRHSLESCKLSSSGSKKKKRVIVMSDDSDSDSDSDSGSKEHVGTNNTDGTKCSENVQENSSDDEKKNEAAVNLDSDSEPPVVSSKTTRNEGSDSGDKKDSEDEMNDDEIVHKKAEMFEKFHGSSSSDEERFISEEQGENSSQGRKNKKKEKKRRPKPVEDEKLKIYSETQRMIREKEISLPYHKPKQRSLKEFLNRRKKTAVNVPLSSSFRKMQEVWKEIEESTQSVSEFFKSESEGEEEKNVEEPKPEEEEFKEKCEEGREVTMRKNSSAVNILDESQSRLEEETAREDQEELQISKVVKDLSADLMEVEMSNCSKNNLHTNDEIVHSAVNEKIDLFAFPVKVVTSNVNEEISESTNAENSKLETDESESNMPTKEISDLEETIDTNSNSARDCKKSSSNWLKNVLEFEEKSKSKFIKRINPKLLEFTPKLSGDPDSFIDLCDEPDNLENGAKMLLDRFVKNAIIPKKKTIKNEFELLVATDERNEKGEICNIISEKLTYRITEDIIIEDTESEKPGAKLQRLRMELEKQMAEKWEEEYKKKLEEEKEYSTAKKKEEEIEEEWEEEEIEDSEEGESEPEENDIELVDKKKTKSKYIDSEAEESGEEGGDEYEEDDVDDNDDNDEQMSSKEEDDEDNEEIEEKDAGNKDDEDEELESLIPAYQPGGGFLHGGSTLTQSAKKNNMDNLLSPSYTLSGMTTRSPYSKELSQSTEISQATNIFTCPDSVDSHRRKLFTDNTSTGNEKFDLEDAYDFCSGRFPGATQKVSEDSQSVEKINGISQLIDEESQEFNADDLISGKFGTQKKFFSSIDDELGEGWLDTQEIQKPTKRRITILEDEDDSNLDTATGLESSTEPEISTSKRLASDDENDNATDGLLVFNKKTKKHLKFSDDEDEGDENKEEEGESDKENELEEEIDEESKEPPEGEVDYDSEENEIIHPTEFIEKEAELSESEWSGDEDEKDLDFLDMEAGDEDKLDNDQVRSQLEQIHMRRVLDDDKREVRLLQELFFEDGDLHSDGKGRDRKFRWKNIGAFDNDENKANESGEENSDDDAVEDEQSRKLRHERALFLMEMKKKEETKSDDENDDDENSILKIGLSVLGKCTKNVLTVNNKPEKEDIVVVKPLGPVLKRGSFLNRNEQYLSKLAKLTGTSDNINGPKHSNKFVFTAKSPEKEKIAPEGNKRKIQDCNETARKKKKSENHPHVKFGPSLLDQLA